MNNIYLHSPKDVSLFAEFLTNLCNYAESLPCNHPRESLKFIGIGHTEKAIFYKCRLCSFILKVKEFLD